MRDLSQNSRAQFELDQISHRITLNELVAAIRHEMNQPLAAIRLYVDSAVELAAPQGSAMLNECLQRITEKLQQADRTLRVTLTAPYPSSTQRLPVNICAIIKHTLDYLATELQNSNIDVALDLCDETSLVQADPDQLQHVLVQLVRNAIDAINAIDEHASCRNLRISTLVLPGQLRVTVSDTGSGIDPSIAARLFTPFQSTKPTGLGLGLATCRKLLEAQGGEIGLQSSSSAGTTFYFELPRCNIDSY